MCDVLNEILKHIKKVLVYPKDPKDHKENDLEEVPISVVSYLEQYEFASTEGVHCL